MKFVALLCLVLGPLSTVSFGQNAAEPEYFEAPGLFRVQSPHPSFSWRRERTQTNDVTTAHYYVCSNNQTSTPLILVVDERAATEDFQRQTFVFEHLKVARQFAERNGFSIVKGKAPKDATKKRVTYSIVGKHQVHDIDLYIAGMVIFSDYRTYTMQAMSPTAESTKQLLSVVRTLKEIPPKLN